MIWRINKYKMIIETYYKVHVPVPKTKEELEKDLYKRMSANLKWVLLDEKVDYQ